jgi:hypothetical protein
MYNSNYLFSHQQGVTSHYNILILIFNVIKMDLKTWGWIKVLGGLVVLWLAWQAGIGMNLAGAITILALLTIAGGYYKATGKVK